MESMQKYQVAVIVYTYNSELKKTLSTLQSAILQHGIKHQIIVADDGSENNHKAEIEELFLKLKFDDYKFSILESNKGITENLRQASILVEAEYIKILSPGDYLSNSDVLFKLYSFAHNDHRKVCFGDAIFYQNLGNERRIPLKNHLNAPCLLKPYDTGNTKAQFKNYLVLNDFILGAAVFTETATYVDYINRIKGHVKYFEDNALRLMIYSGITVSHYPDIIMWYEYGTGISTSGSGYWLEQCRKDYNETCKLIYKEKKKHGFNYNRIRFVYAHNGGLALWRLILFPEMFVKFIVKWSLSKIHIGSSFRTLSNTDLNNLLLAEYGEMHEKI